MTLTVLDARQGPLALISFGENTAEAGRQAVRAKAIADAMDAKLDQYGADDLLDTITGRTLLKADGTTGSEVLALESNGISIRPNDSTRFAVVNTFATEVATGIWQRFSFTFRATTISGATLAAIGFGPAGSRVFIAFQNTGASARSNDASVITAISTSPATFTVNQDCDVVVTYDGAGTVSVTITTPQGSNSFTVTDIPDGPVWLAAKGASAGTIRFLSPLTVEAVPPLTSVVVKEQADAIATISSGAGVGRLLEPTLDIVRRGRTTTPIAPTRFNRTWVYADVMAKPWRAKSFAVYLLADTPIFLKRFDDAGDQIGSDFQLAGVTGPNEFTQADLAGFSGEAGEYLGFYTAECGVTVGVPETGSGWWSGTNTVNASTVDISGSPTTANTLEAFFEVEQAPALSSGGSGVSEPTLLGQGVVPDATTARTPPGFTCTGLAKFTRGQFKGCWAVADDGRLVEGDASPFVPRIQIISPDFQRILRTIDPGYTGASAQGIAIDTSGSVDTIWLATSADKNIRHYQLDGTEIVGDAYDTAGAGYSGNANGLAYDADTDTLLLTTTAGGTLYRIDTDPLASPREIETFAMAITDPDQLFYHDGAVYVTTGDNGTPGQVRKFTLATSETETIFTLPEAEAIEGLHIDFDTWITTAVSDGGYHESAKPALNLWLQYRVPELSA